MDLENERIFLGGREPGRLHDPALNPGSARRGVPDLLDGRELLVLEHVVVHGRDAGERLAGGAPQVEADHVRGMLRIAAHADGHSGPRDRRHRDDLNALGRVAHRAREIRKVDVDRPAVPRGEVDALAVGRPEQVARVAVEAVGDVAHPRPVDPGDEQVRGAVGMLRRIVSRERHAPAVRRHRGVRPVARSGHELPNRAARDVERVQARHPILPVPGRVPQTVEHDGPPVGSPIVPRPEHQAVEPRPHIPVPRRELARRAAVRRDEEEMREALLHIAHAVLAVMQVVHHARRGRPLRALGRLGQRDSPETRVGHEHHERDRLAARRPLRIRRRLAHARHLGRGALGVHPAHEQLRPLGLAVGEIEDAGAVGGPAGVRALEEEAMVRAVGVHDPEGRLPLVVDLVHPAARVDDLRPVRGDLGVLHLLPVEVMVHREQRVGRGLLRGRGQRERREQQRGKRQAGWVSHGFS